MKKSFLLSSIAAAVLVLYLTGCGRNQPPVIEKFTTDPASDTLVTAGDTVAVICRATDPDEDSLTYELEADAGEFVQSGQEYQTLWIAPDTSGTYMLTCTVSDGDTLYDAADTLVIEVQNYFPMNLANQWTYVGTWLEQEFTLQVSVLRKEEEAGANRWRIKRVFSRPSAEPFTDSASYYSISGDSITYYDAYLQTSFLQFLMPLWLEKTWSGGEGITGTVVESDTVGTEGGIFFNCFKVDVENVGQAQQTFSYWVAPDVGIIRQDIQMPFIGQVEFELTEYEGQ